MRTNKRYVLLVILVLSSLLAAACGETTTISPPIEPPKIPLDPVFNAFFAHLGGESELGPPIAPAAKEGQATVQYVWGAKLVFDPTAPATSYFSLAPLGVMMGISDPPTPLPRHPQLHHINGHTIFPDFYPLYEKLGVNMVGLPLTEVRHNYIYGRWEQLFENLGFYRMDGSEEVHLLGYGGWACGESCLTVETAQPNAIIDSKLLQKSKIDIQSGQLYDAAFVDWVNDQGTDFSGYPLDVARIAPDGKWEQILENVVLVTESHLPGGEVVLRPLSELLGILPEAPRPFSGNPNMFFLSTGDPNLGYEIPKFFWQYIRKHGGLSLFGAPITHFNLLTGSSYHQCFQNLCLTYEPGSVEGSRIRPEPLGYAYKLLLTHSGEGGAQPVPAEATAIPTLISAPTLPALEPTASPQVISSPEPLPTNAAPQPMLPTAAAPTQPLPTEPVIREITIQVYVRYRTVETKDAQEIAVRVLTNGVGEPGAVVDVTVGMPDGTMSVYAMPVTDINGYSSVTLPVIAAPPSTVIPYKTCYLPQPELRVCVSDSFVIWYTQ